MAFDTGRGLVYAQASGWARVYLLWTFRNFRSLPQKVLNPRQQELIAALYRTASQKSPRQFEDALIGTVEGFIPPARIAAAQPIPSTSSSDTAAARIAGRSRRVFNFGFAFDRFSLTRWDFSRLASSGMTVKVGTGLLAAIVVVLGWRQSRSQTVLVHWASAAWSVRAAPAPQTSVRPVLMNQILISQVPISQVASPEVPAGALRTAPASESVSRELPASAAVSNRLDATPAIPRRANLFVTHALTIETQTHQVASHQAFAPKTPAEAPRIQISGPPRKLVYPVCPSTNTRGKVSLHAVVGSDGVVSQVKVVRGDRALAAAAVEAVRQWRYQPSTGDASGSERETNITVSFVSSEVVAVSFPDSAISR